ncbi:hypothetical protein ABW19_dt0205431 [Dactylella cylindrospora]|nr:hypothetical protein ABW19_dt0205431 [Dactylella cylindrospora]
MPTQTILPPDGDSAFGIRVDPLDASPYLIGEQYLYIFDDYALILNGTSVVGWYIDDNIVSAGDGTSMSADRSLIFDNTGLILGVAPLDAPPVRYLNRRDVNDTSDDEDYTYTLKAAGTAYTPAPTRATTLSEWGRFRDIQPTGVNFTDALHLVDRALDPVDLTFLGCRGVLPSPSVTAFQLNAVYDYDSFVRNPDIGPPYAEDCIRVSLVAFTRSSTTSTTSSTPTHTAANWTYFPIEVTFADSFDRDDQTERDITDVGYYISQEGDYTVISHTNNPMYFRYNMTKFLLVEGSADEYLEIFVPSADNSTTYQFNRFELLGNNSLNILDGDSVLDIPWIGCLLLSENDSWTVSAAFDLEALVAEQPQCRQIFLRAGVDILSSSTTAATTTVPTTVESTTTPMTTVTESLPNVSQCNLLNYTSAYSATGDINEFATACFCYSFIASTTYNFTTETCTPTFVQIIPTVTSIFVTGVLESQLVAISDDIAPTVTRQLQPRDTTTYTVISGSVVSSTLPTGITSIPTPTEYASAEYTDIVSSCSDLFDANGITPLTVTSIETSTITVGTTTEVKTEIRTFCYERVSASGSAR